MSSYILESILLLLIEAIHVSLVNLRRKAVSVPLGIPPSKVFRYGIVDPGLRTIV